MQTARIPVFVFALLGFVVSAAVYMNADMGVAPYDVVSVIAHKNLLSKIPYRFIRMAFDFAAIGAGTVFGGKPGLGVILMALLLGSSIQVVGKIMKR